MHYILMSCITQVSTLTKKQCTVYFGISLQDAYTFVTFLYTNYFSYGRTLTNEEGAHKTSQFSQPEVNVHQIFMNWQEWMVTFGGSTVKHKNIPEYQIR